MTASLALLQALARLYPIYPGRGRLALSSLGRTQDDELRRERLRTGEWIYVFPNDYIGRMVLFFGDLDPAVTDFVVRNVRPGDVVVDVGANVGLITLPAATRVGPEGRVVSVEPNAQLVATLERSVAENRLRHVTLVNKALSEEPGTLRLLVPRNGLGQACLSDEGTEVCEVVRLDDLPLDDGRPVRLLKIDVEGHEASVLKGGRRFLRERSPDFVLFESHRSRGAFWQREEVTLLSGYEIFELRRGLLRSRIVPIPRTATYEPGGYDFVAVKPGVTPA